MKHIVNFSGGACSFCAARRVIERYGSSDVVLLFADTKVEDRDLYEFNEKASAVLGIPITRVCEGRTPWQLFRDEGLIGNNQHPICSIQLKREPLNAWQKAHFEMEFCQTNFCKENAVMYVGFDWTEMHRVEAIRTSYPRWKIEAPMAEQPLWDKCRMLEECLAVGLSIPSLYREGFPHNNCGGRCVRAGITHWVHLLKKRPAAFQEWELEELETMAVLGNRGINFQTMLKDRRGGVVKSLSLMDLRMRVESGEKFPDDEWGGCGCGGTE